MTVQLIILPLGEEDPWIILGLNHHALLPPSGE